MDVSKLFNEEDSLIRFGLLVERDEKGSIRANVAHIRHHSPTGYECGYAGSGPADLALSVMHALIPPLSEGAEDAIFELTGAAFDDAIANPANHAQKLGPDGVRVSDLAYVLHQKFKEDFIVRMPKEGGLVPIEEIRAWIQEAVRNRYGLNLTTLELRTA